MVGMIELISPTSVQRGFPFVVTIDVRAVTPGQGLTLTLAQKRGTKPFFPSQSSIGVASAGGVVSASFTIMLSGPGSAVLLATAYDRNGTYFEPDGERIEVL